MYRFIGSRCDRCEQHIPSVQCPPNGYLCDACYERYGPLKDYPVFRPGISGPYDIDANGGFANARRVIEDYETDRVY
jgi:hypothetical protein